MLKYLLVVLLPLIGISVSVAQYANSEYVEIEGVKIHYRVWKRNAQIPAKSKILCIHGFCGSTFSWEKTAQALSQNGYEVMAIDLPPFGYSDKRKEINHSISAQAILALDFIDFYDATHLDDKEAKWILMGHSMGGSVIGAMASHRPENLEACIFVDGLMFRTAKEPNWLRRELLGSNTVYNFGEWIGKYYFFKEKRIQKILTMAYASPADKVATLGYLNPLKGKGTAGGIMEMTISKELFSYSVNDLTLPILVIWGELDKVIPIQEGEKFKAKLPQAQYVVVPKAGHCPMETEPLITNTAILNFLAKEVK